MVSLYPAPLEGHDLYMVTQNQTEGNRPHDNVVVCEFLYRHNHSTLFYKAVFNCTGWVAGDIVTDPDLFKAEPLVLNRDKSIPVEQAELKSFKKILSEYGLGDCSGIEVSLLRRMEYLMAQPESKNSVVVRNGSEWEGYSCFQYEHPQIVDKFHLRLDQLYSHVIMKNPPTHELYIHLDSGEFTEFFHILGLETSSYSVSRAEKDMLLVTFAEPYSKDHMNIYLEQSGLTGENKC